MTSLQTNLNDPAIQTLCKADPLLGKLIHTVGNMTIPLRTNYYEALVSAIISQQISVKAAATIKGRVTNLVNDKVTPAAMTAIEDETLRNAGLSKQKLSYLRDLTEKFQEIDTSLLHTMENNEIIVLLTNIKGIGKWTAEIFLLFSLGRSDVLPVDDVGLHRAAKWLYTLDTETKGKKALQERAPMWKGAETIASIYLWEAVNRNFVLDYKHIDDVLIERK